ncbi:exodeoxyribonuclease V subunit beta [[Haemophilus] ducreyi]
MNNLDPLALPLNGTSLIEASAGTGKTFTMANLYLRLLLGIGCQPLTVEEILVVTFTKAATEELRDRIRRNIKACREFFCDYNPNQIDQNKDNFYSQLYERVDNLDEAKLRLRIAEREIDLASIFTIHSFCQKILSQFAFDSGIRFDNDWQTDESHLLQQLSEEIWREQFYPLSLQECEIIYNELEEPLKALKMVQSFIGIELPALSAEQKRIFTPELSTRYLIEYKNFLQQIKQYWQINGNEIVTIINAELKKIYKTGEKKALNRTSYQPRYLATYQSELDNWANSMDLTLPKNFERFCQDFIASKAQEGAVTTLSHPHFQQNQQWLNIYQQKYSDKKKPFLLYQFLVRLRAKLADYKITHSEKSFNDMLTLLNQALKSDNGDQLAAKVRCQYPFAMIDEFQDTDKQQYEIFSKIFMQGEQTNRGFIMIGDPKQSIYQFRGTDIFTYLNAANEVQEKRTLPKNWRSLPSIVQAANRLFSFPPESPHSPFLYDEIGFQQAIAKETDTELKGLAHCIFYLQPKFDFQRAAEHCAYQIQQQLKQMEAGKFGLKLTDNPAIQPFQAKDIAILVRNKKEANYVKQALANCGIRSVYLSEDRSVYQSDLAQDLLWLLYACLNPYQQSTLLTVVGSSLWGLSATEIYQLKHNEIAWDNLVERFVDYQHIWQRQGILPMLHQLFLCEGLIKRLCANPQTSDRNLTDLLHLAELLQNAMSSLENESALVRWYEHQLADDNKNEAHQLRLESENQLVQIVTIHKAKGLQYPIVWLPFIGEERGYTRKKDKNLKLYRDATNQECWLFGHADEQTKTLLEKGEHAEDLRLLYVALTRAESQLNVILPQQFTENWNAVHYLLSDGELFLNKQFNPKTTVDYLDNKQFDDYIKLDEKALVDDWRPTIASQADPIVRTFDAIIRKEGQITSFTALHHYHQAGYEKQYPARNVLIDTADHDSQQLLSDLMLEPISEAEQAYSVYNFPHSAKVGTILHYFFEKADFQQALELAQVATICEQLNIEEQWQTVLQQWFTRVFATPFAEQQIALQDISCDQRLNEWGFYLRLTNEHALKELNELLQKYGSISKDLPELQLPQLAGYVRGSVDCLAKVNGKFYVIDYKSNFLGSSAQDYSQQNLVKTIGQYRYDLQYLLYSLAVHRYLRSRLAEHYDYERDFGGAVYLFLRGMNGTANSGVFFDKPSLTLITKMDELFC